MLLTINSFEEQISAFVNDLTINIASKQRHQQTLFAIIFDESITSYYYCTCDSIYSYKIPLGITNDSCYGLNYWSYQILTVQLLVNIQGFQTCCLPFNVLLSSTLE